jgi:hypothetical protein
MRIPVLALFLLAACNTPPLGFQGIPATTVIIDGSVFDIRVRDSRASAIRTNREWAPRLEFVEHKARIAIERVSGCKVAQLVGDAASMLASLSCDGRPAPDISGPDLRKLQCESVDSEYSGTAQDLMTDFDCHWVD